MNISPIDENVKMYYTAQEKRFGGQESRREIIDSPRKRSYIKFIIEHINKENVKKILLEGCSNLWEDSIFREYGFEDITCIDLYPWHGVKKMDMHRLGFEENTFDLISFSHSLEHTYNPVQVLREAGRVLKKGGYICFEIPVNFVTNDIDRFDFADCGTLINFINNIFAVEKIYGENFPHGHEENFCCGDCSKLIVRKV